MTTDKKDQRNFPTNAMDETIRCSCTLELPDDGSVEYQSFWSDPREGQLFACTESSKPKRKQRAPKTERLTTDQLTELLAIDKLIGLRGRLQRLIHALNSGGQDIDAPAEDIIINYRCEWWEVERQRQALVLWQKGIGRALGFSSYRKYIASIPEVPAHLRKGNGKFNRLLLVEGRMGLSKLCELAGVLCHCSDLQDTNNSVRWIRCQEGRKYRGHNTGVAQLNFEKREVGLNLFEGVCLYLQFPRVLSEAFAIMLTELPLSFSDYTPVNLLKITGGVGPQLYTEHVGFEGWNVGTASKLSF